jgi:membrane dipeptidase
LYLKVLQLFFRDFDQEGDLDILELWYRLGSAPFRAPVVASHVALRAVCENPGNMPDDILRAIAAKGGLVGIHLSAGVISQRYYDWTLTHPPVRINGLTIADLVRAELPLIRSPNRDYAEYIDALDAEMGGIWRRMHEKPW